MSIVSGNVSDLSKVQVACNNNCEWQGEATELEEYANGIMMFCPDCGAGPGVLPVLLASRRYRYPETYDPSNPKHLKRVRFMGWYIYQGQGGKIITVDFVT